MADENQIAPETAVDGSAAPQDAGGEKKPGFLSTTAGKVVAIGAALALLLVVVAIAGFVVLTFVVGGAVDELADQITTPGTPPASDTGTATAGSGEGTASADAEPKEYGVKDLHVFRDIFQPLLTPVVATSTPDGSSTPTDTGTTTPPATYEANTLYLLSISSVSGSRVGSFVWNDTLYLASEGSRLGDSPWRVLSLSDTSAVMQYGDNQVSLSVGQAIAK